MTFSGEIFCLELPPHTRRRVLYSPIGGRLHGITSAYAEKSSNSDIGIGKHRNYLRIRGEERDCRASPSRYSELPPHTRRRVHSILFDVIDIGITSAYAEKSLMLHDPHATAWNYLRIRGEEARAGWVARCKPELPPHTRRRDCVTCENFNVQRRFVTLQPIRSRVTTCRPSLLYFCAVDQECSQRILALDWNRY